MRQLHRRLRVKWLEHRIGIAGVEVEHHEADVGVRLQARARRCCGRAFGIEADGFAPLERRLGRRHVEVEIDHGVRMEIQRVIGERVER